MILLLILLAIPVCLFGLMMAVVAYWDKTHYFRRGEVCLKPKNR